MKHFQWTMNGDVAVVQFVDTCIDGNVCGKMNDPESFVSECRGLMEALDCQKIALDFSGITFFCSGAIGALMSLNKRAIALGGKVVFFQVENVHLIEKFKITRLNEAFFFAPTLEDAIRCF